MQLENFFSIKSCILLCIEFSSSFKLIFKTFQSKETQQIASSYGLPGFIPLGQAGGDNNCLRCVGNRLQSLILNMH